MPLTTLPIDFDLVRVALVRFIRAATGLDEDHVIAMEPEVAYDPRPTLPYCGVKIMSVMKYGDDCPVTTDAGTMYGGPRGCVVSINTFGKSHEQAQSVMGIIQAAVEIPPYRDLLAAFNIAPWRTGAIQDLSMLLNTGYEGRAQMDLFCGLSSETGAVDLGTIDEANVVGQVQTDAGAVTITVHEGT